MSLEEFHAEIESGERFEFGKNWKAFLKKLNKEIKKSGLTIVPLKLYINDKGFAKILIALARGKKLYDKRETIKDRDNKRNLDRIKKTFKKN